MLRFRAFEDQDLGVLAPWLFQAGLGLPAGVSREQLGRRLREDKRIICRAALGHRRQVVGFFRLDLAPDGTAEVTLIVAPSQRNKGIGRRLLDAALAEARGHGLRGLVAVVRDTNRSAIRLFQDKGFERGERALSGYVVLERMVHQAENKPPIEVVS